MTKQQNNLMMYLGYKPSGELVTFVRPEGLNNNTSGMYLSLGFLELYHIQELGSLVTTWGSRGLN